MTKSRVGRTPGTSRKYPVRADLERFQPGPERRAWLRWVAATTSDRSGGHGATASGHAPTWTTPPTRGRLWS